MPADLQPLIDEITAIKGEDDSAIAFVNGLAARIQAAVDAALANGATGAQLQPVIDIAAAAKTESDALAAAILANGG
jgi:hypothetical protein